jgi:DNA gyrase subunit A
MKVWRLPAGDPRTKAASAGQPAPAGQGETITSVMPLPEDERDWDKLDVMFATKSGGVRRNKLSDFVQVNRNGKIAMKPDEGDGIVGVQICSEEDDVLLTTAQRPVHPLPHDGCARVQGPDSTGVRGVDLKDGDSVIGMAVLKHVDVTSKEVSDFFKWDAQSRGDVEVEQEEAPAVEGDAAPTPFERLAWLKTQEQFILTMTTVGLGKRASAYEYRVTNRGGKGLIAHKLTGEARIVASFPVLDQEELLLVTDKGQLIRTAIDQIRIAGRATQGVILINVADDEHVVAAERLEALGGEAGEAEPEGEGSGK